MLHSLLILVCHLSSVSTLKSPVKPVLLDIKCMGRLFEELTDHFLLYCEVVSDLWALIFMRFGVVLMMPYRACRKRGEELSLQENKGTVGIWCLIVSGLVIWGSVIGDILMGRSTPLCILEPYS